MFTNSTPNYGLPQWVGSDKPTYLVDQNNAYLKIDQEIYAASQEATAANSTATNAKNQADTAITTANSALTTAQGVVETANEALTVATNANDNAGAAKAAADKASKDATDATSTVTDFVNNYGVLKVYETTPDKMTPIAGTITNSPKMLSAVKLVYTTELKLLTAVLTGFEGSGIVGTKMTAGPLTYYLSIKLPIATTSADGVFVPLGRVYSFYRPTTEDTEFGRASLVVVANGGNLWIAIARDDLATASLSYSETDIRFTCFLTPFTGLELTNWKDATNQHA